MRLRRPKSVIFFELFTKNLSVLVQRKWGGVGSEFIGILEALWVFVLPLARHW
jgi:hypothetical protein